MTLCCWLGNYSWTYSHQSNHVWVIGWWFIMIFGAIDRNCWKIDSNGATWGWRARKELPNGLLKEINPIVRLSVEPTFLYWARFFFPVPAFNCVVARRYCKARPQTHDARGNEPGLLTSYAISQQDAFRYCLLNRFDFRFMLYSSWRSFSHSKSSLLVTADCLAHFWNAKEIKQPLMAFHSLKQDEIE